MSGHTPEPEIDLFRCSVTAHSHEFRLMKDDVIVAVLTDEHGGTYVEDGQIATSINEQYGLRFLAAWNACAGIPTDALEADVVKRMRDKLSELAADLESELDGRYPKEIREYPSEERRYQRDMSIVNEARAILKELDR